MEWDHDPPDLSTFIVIIAAMEHKFGLSTHVVSNRRQKAMTSRLGLPQAGPSPPEGHSHCYERSDARCAERLVGDKGTPVESDTQNNLNRVLVEIFSERVKRL